MRLVLLVLCVLLVTLALIHPARILGWPVLWVSVGILVALLALAVADVVRK